MLRQEMMAIFIEASERFLNEERDLIFSGVSERCLCGALMLRLRSVLDRGKYVRYFTDIEYNRNFGGQAKEIITDELRALRITCDIIIHSRGMIKEQDNLIAIEMKRQEHPEYEKNRDRDRLKALTRADPQNQIFPLGGVRLPQYVCGYPLGVFYEICIEEVRVNIEYYCDGKLFKSYSKMF